MKTIRVSNEQMQKRIARYRALEPLTIQKPSIPERARDVVFWGKLPSVLGLEARAHTSINAEAAIFGARRITKSEDVGGRGPMPAFSGRQQVLSQSIKSEPRSFPSRHPGAPRTEPESLRRSAELQEA